MERYLTCALVAILLTLYAWLGGGIVAPWLAPWTPWITLLIGEVALLLPEQKRNETLFDARRRVWRGIVRDPLTWCSVALIAFLTLQWLNACVTVEWNPEAKAWQLPSPVSTALITEDAVQKTCAYEYIAPYVTPEVKASMEGLPPNEAMGVLLKGLTPPDKPEAILTVHILDTQPWPGLPWSLFAAESRNALDWFPPILVALIAVRHALLKRNKRALMGFACVMSAVLALAGIVQYALDGQFLYWGMNATSGVDSQGGLAYFFATFGYPNHAASWFSAVMLLSIGMALWASEHRDAARLHPVVYIVCAVLCCVSAILSGSRAGMLFALFIVAFAALYIPFRCLGSWSPSARFSVLGTLFLVAAVTLGTAAFRLYVIDANQTRADAIETAQADLAKAKSAGAQEAIDAALAAKSNAEALPHYGEMPSVDLVFKEIYDTDWEVFFEDPIRGRSGYQGILAGRQHDAYPWFGSGAWSFRWLNTSYINPDAPEEKSWFGARGGVGQANVHNDTLQFLAEHGWIGFGLMLGCLASLALPFLWVLFTSPRHAFTDTLADRWWLNRIDAYCVFALVAILMMTVHSFIDIVFRSPACMLLYGLLFVCAPGFVLNRTSNQELTHA